MPSGGKSYSKPPVGARKSTGSRKRPAVDFQPTKGGGGRGVWRSRSGTVLGTSKSEDSPIRRTKRTGQRAR